MRMLPDNPSLEFLRREAKDLLAARRELDPATTLADAQRSLADLYGVRDWAALRAEVERRRAAVPEAEPGLGAALAEAFGLGELRSPMTPIGYQHMGRSWLLETDEGRWSAQPVFAWIGEEQAAVGADLLERARGEGVLAPTPRRDADGRLVRRVGEQNWRVDEWMDLGPTPIRPVRAAVARRIGEILGAIHAVGPPTDAPMNPYLTTRRPMDDWGVLVERARAAGKDFAESLAAMLPIVEELRDVPVPTPDATIVSICDLVPEAVRYGPADELILVHWAFSGTHVPAWELGYVLLQWAGYGGINVGAAGALLEGYRSRGPGFDRPLEIGDFNVGVSGYLNWTFNAFCEAIDPEDPERGAFADRAARELLADPLTVEQLHELLAAQTVTKVAAGAGRANR